MEKLSAINVWGNTNVDTILSASHVSIVKPRSHHDETYMILRRFVLGPTSVFLSVGGRRTEAQERFVTSLKNFFRSRDLSLRTVDDYGSTDRQPLKDVEYRMDRCYGAVVLAFERTYINAGVSRRGAVAEEAVKDAKLPPVWNHIEAAMAYTLGLPLLVLVERGLQVEGMLEDKYDWRVKRVAMENSVVEDPDFLGMFEAWRTRVLERRDKSLSAS